MAQKKKVTKEEKSVLSLSEILSGLKGFQSTVLEKDAKNIFDVPYRIPFNNKGLQSITGGILGGKFIEISGDSQTGKSFLLYELVKGVQDMGGYAILWDGERALEEDIIKMVGIDNESGTLALQYDMDIVNFFSVASSMIVAIREKNKKCPILIGVDSFPAFTLPDAILSFNYYLSHPSIHSNSLKLSSFCA